MENTENAAADKSGMSLLGNSICLIHQVMDSYPGLVFHASGGVDAARNVATRWLSYPTRRERR